MVEAYIDSSFHLICKNEKTSSSDYCEYRRKWEDNPNNFITGEFPIHIDIETTTACNLKCFMCFQSYDPPKPAKMSTEMIKKIIDEGAENNLCSIKLQYRGEPLTDVRIPEIVNYAKSRGILEVMFNTNATLLSEEKAYNLIKAGLDKIICSVDGCTKEVYENVRIGGKFEVVLQNIKTMQKLKKELGVDKPVVRVQMVDTPRNHEEIDHYIPFWSEIADEVAIEDMLDWDQTSEDLREFPSFACAQLWQRLIILADGTVLPCCRSTSGGNMVLYSVGNIHEMSLKEIWTGDRMNYLRELHKSGNSDRVKLCRLCGYRTMLLDKEIYNSNSG